MFLEKVGEIDFTDPILKVPEAYVVLTGDGKTTLLQLILIKSRTIWHKTPEPVLNGVSI